MILSMLKNLVISLKFFNIYIIIEATACNTDWLAGHVCLSLWFDAVLYGRLFDVPNVQQGLL